MKGTIDMGDGRLIELECNAATPFIGKKLFNVDFLRFFQNINDYDSAEQMELVQKMAFTLAMQGKMPWREVVKLTEEDYVDWLCGFDYEEMVDKIAIKAVELWNSNEKTASKPKN